MKKNENLGFQDRGGVHYLSNSSIGSDVPEPVLLYEEEDFLLDDEEDPRGFTTFGCCAVLGRVVRFMAGSRTSFLMALVVLAVLLFCTLSAELHDEPQGLLIWIIIYIYMIATLQVLHLIRWLWKVLIVELAFPDSRSLPFVTDAIDPKLWVLAWTIIQYATWQTLLVKEDEGEEDSLWTLPFLPESWPLLETNDRYVRVVKLTFVSILLWAIRDVAVQAVMVKLLLGFLMNFNDEVIGLFHKYSLLRRLNAGWIRLIPFSMSDVKEPSLATVHSHPSPPAQLTMARTAALMRREGSKMQLLDAVRARDDSKGRLQIPVQSNTKDSYLYRQTSKGSSGSAAPKGSIQGGRGSLLGSKGSLVGSKGSLVGSKGSLVGSKGSLVGSKGSLVGSKGSLSNSKGSLPGGRGSQDDVSIKVDEPSPERSPSKTARRMFPPLTTAAQKRRKVREFHVETTGRAVPPLLEQQNIYALAKSRLLNMICINWVKKDPIVFFVDGQRTELTSKKVARQAATQIFDSLLQFRQSIAAFEEELAEEELAAQLPPETPRSADSIDSVKVTEAAAPIVTFITEPQQQATPPQTFSLNMPPKTPQLLTPQPLNPPPPSSPQPLSAPPPSSPQPLSAPPPSSPQPHSTPQPVGGTMSAPVSTPQAPDSPSSASDYESNEPKARVKWFGRGRKTPEPTSPSSKASPPLSPPVNKVFNEAHLAAITAAEIKKVKVIMPDDRDCLTQDFFELFMSQQDAKELMEFLDPGKLGKVTSKMFLKGVVTVYRLRKQMVTSLEAQEEIEATFRRVCVYLFSIIAVLIFLIALGINANTIIVSGAAVLTAISLVLSFVYTDFIQSIILIVFLNPYRIGDRVRIDGEAQYVKRITTYFTEFESLHGKVQYISHKELSNKLLINESRCKVATTEIAVMFSEKTTPSQYASLKKVLDAYLKSRPLEWIGDSLFMFIQGIGPSQFIEVSIWATHTESWGNWMAIRTQESAFFHFIMRQATVLGMYYRLPIQRWEPSASFPSHQVPNTYGGSAPRSPMPKSNNKHHPVFEHSAQHGSPPPSSCKPILPSQRPSQPPSRPSRPSRYHDYNLLSGGGLGGGDYSGDYGLGDDCVSGGGHEWPSPNEYSEWVVSSEDLETEKRIEKMEDLRDERLMQLRRRH